MKPALLLLIACLSPWVAVGSMGKIPILQIESYRSPSTKWQLEVDPGNREGSGKGSYQMALDGNAVWQVEHPFTLQDAEVTDSGMTVGYAYSHGLRGHGDPDTLNFVILNAEGGVVLNDAVDREDAPYPDGLPGPMANGIIVHPGEDRVIMRLQSEFQESWRVYQLSTGKKLDTFDLKAASKVPEGARFVVAAKAIQGVPLVLVHWWFHDSDKAGAVFSIVDFKGCPVWSLELPQDYSMPDDEAAEDRLREQIRREGGILNAEGVGAFEVRLVADGQRAKFKVERDSKAASGWTVTEASREKFQAPPEVDSKPAAVFPPLQPIGSFVLGDSPTTGAIRDIQEFDIDGDGRFGFLRRDEAGAMTFVLVDAQATVVAEVPLAVEKEAVHLAWLGGWRWVITASPFGVGGKNRAWWLDAEKRNVREIAGFDSPSVDAIRGTSDGGFVVLASQRQKFSSTDFLIAFDEEGKERWKHGEHSDSEASSLLSPEDITVTTRREIAVVDNIRHTVQLFDLAGVLVRTVDLKKVWKREPNYPSGIMPDADGGFIVEDFHGSPPFVRMGSDGSVVGEISPKRRDGRVIDAGIGLRAAPDGKLWACDGESFIQLSNQGLAIREIGSTADDDILGKITAVSGDELGNVYAVDQRTGAVHVFDSDGAKLRICKPANDDFTQDLIAPHLTITGEGGVLLEMAEERYLSFGPDGARQAMKHFGLDDITEEWHAQPGTGNLLVLGYGAAFLVDPVGKLKVKIDRQADRRWFENLSGAAFASDGSFVIHSTSDGRAENILTFFNAAGAPLGTITLEENGFAGLGGFNGRYATFGGSDGVRVYDRDGKAIAATPKTVGNSSHFLTRGGRELWVVNHGTRKVDRYEMPE